MASGEVPSIEDKREEDLIADVLKFKSTVDQLTDSEARVKELEQKVASLESELERSKARCDGSSTAGDDAGQRAIEAEVDRQRAEISQKDAIILSQNEELQALRRKLHGPPTGPHETAALTADTAGSLHGAIERFRRKRAAANPRGGGSGGAGHKVKVCLNGRWVTIETARAMAAALPPSTPPQCHPEPVWRRRHSLTARMH